VKTRTDFPNAVRTMEHVWVPLAGGARLGARLWLPEDADTHPVPAILEYIPYRKRDGTRFRDEPIHYYFAGHGYASVRIDLRGSGESDGVLEDEYLPQEWRDGLDAIAWIAAQPWCTGVVGLLGKSWGGINALQIAALDPPALAAVISVCSADDRYHGDAHYMGGCLLAENLLWGANLLTVAAQPPDPELLGDAWLDRWLERLDAVPLYLERWLGHQLRDEYWRSGSVCEDYHRIRVPVYAIGGWADAYANTVPRLLAGLSGPRKGLVGPWAHLYPHEGVPRPAIGFLQEALRWWDHWLKGCDTGIMDEPLYRVWLQESIGPRGFYKRRPGRWIAESAWPSPRIERHRWAINWRRLEQRAREEEALEFRSPENVGLASGSWCSFGEEGEMPLDQREDDGKSLNFDSEPLGDAMEILGAPIVELVCQVDRPRANLAFRLNDIGPDGSVTRVTYGLKNLTHDEDSTSAGPLEPGRRVTIRVVLNHIAHRFCPGHRLRLSISTNYWPLCWPAPEPVTLTAYTGSSSLVLPVRPPRAEDAALPEFERPEGAPGPAETTLRPGHVTRRIEREITTGETVYAVNTDLDTEGKMALFRIEEIGLDVGHTITERFAIRDGDPLSARADITHNTLTRRRDWCARVETTTHLHATSTTFLLESTLTAFHGDERIFRREWRREIPREAV